MRRGAGNDKEIQQMLAGLAKLMASTKSAREEAVQSREAASTMGMREYEEWSKKHPLSARGRIHLSLLEKELNRKEIERGRKFKVGRQKGSLAATTKHILTLLIAYPGKSAKKLQALSPDPAVQNMNHRTFANRVSELRKQLKD